MTRESKIVSVLLLVSAIVASFVALQTGDAAGDSERTVPAPIVETIELSKERKDADRGISFASSVAGGSADTTDVTTAGQLSGEPGDVFVAAIATRPATGVKTVSGLGLDWFPVAAQCSGRGTTSVSVWGAVGVPTASGPVSVGVNGSGVNVSVIAAAYSGVDPVQPFGNIAGHNGSDRPGDCAGAVDETAYSLDVERVQEGNNTLVVTATRHRDLTVGPDFVARADAKAGTGGDVAGVSLADDTATPADGEPGDVRAISGELSGVTDWSALTIELVGRDATSSVPALRWSTDVISFDHVDAPGTAPAGMARQSLTLHNDGVEEVLVSGVEIEGPDADLFRLDGPASFALGPGATRELLVSLLPDVTTNATAELTVRSNGVNPTSSPVLIGRGGTRRDGIWISEAELLRQPTTGAAWERLLDAANSDLGEADLSDFTSKHDVGTMAVALVAARTNDDRYRTIARDEILSAIGTEAGTTTAVQPCRNVAAYVIAADLIGLQGFDEVADGAVRAWISELRDVEWPDGTFVEEDDERANNHGRMCGMARVVIAAYLGDQPDLAAAAETFARLLGDTTAGTPGKWVHELSWQADPENPVGINPVGAERDGLLIDGALPEEMRRGGPFAVRPAPTGYPWEALQGIVVEAVVLDRAGYDVFDWSDRAILRSVDFIARLDRLYPDDGWWAHSDDTWVPWVINARYGSDYPTEKARIGKNMGWTDWTHSSIAR